MYSDYKELGYYNSYRLKEDQTRMPTNHFDSTFPLSSSNSHNALHSQMEESKQNICFNRNYLSPSKTSSNFKLDLNEYTKTQFNSKKDWEKSYKNGPKSSTSKSSKNIKFLEEYQQDHQFSKKYIKNFEDHKASESKKQNLKSITMSLDYKTLLKDLLPTFNTDHLKINENSNDLISRTMKSSKSQKRINLELDEPYRLPKYQPSKTQYNAKSYKTIVDILAQNKLEKIKEEKDVINFTRSNKRNNTANIDYNSKSQTSKTVSYSNNLKHQVESANMKKHEINDSNKSSALKDPLHKHKISILDFELGSCKGQGAFGQVFPAIHKETKMLVAIKKVPKEKVRLMLDQFINEIKIQMYISHENIVSLYGCFDDSTNFYIIMEYMEGGNLFGLIKKKKKLPQVEAALRLKEICLAMKQMHENSILHRDIKPENIVITNDVCKVCDFGWSAYCKDRRTTYCGTLDYVSPQIIGGEGYDDSVDIWCIGVLAYEMICGKTPFYNISRKQTMNRIVNVNYEYPPQVTSTAKSFIDKILKKDPNDRIDISEVLKDKFLSQ